MKSFWPFHDSHTYRLVSLVTVNQPLPLCLLKPPKIQMWEVVCVYAVEQSKCQVNWFQPQILFMVDDQSAKQLAMPEDACYWLEI